MIACAWCLQTLPSRLRRGAVYCSQRCRQRAFRARRRSALRPATDSPLTFAYADPPYPGKARRFYRSEEVDHEELVASLVDGGYSGGWALSTSAAALRDLLPLCPEGTRVCAWAKPGGVPGTTYGPHNVWEPLLVCGGRLERGGVRDALYAHPARLGGTLPGRKPLGFCVWLFELWGARPGDSLVDLFPGTGIVSAAWTARGGVSVSDRGERREPSSTATSDVSPAGGDGSPRGQPGAAAVARAWRDSIDAFDDTCETCGVPVWRVGIVRARYCKRCSPFFPEPAVPRSTGDGTVPQYSGDAAAPPTPGV